MSRLNVDQIYSRIGTGVPEIEIPILSVDLSTTQSVGDAVETLVEFDNVIIDTHSWFDTNTHGYTPQIAGYYLFTWRVAASGTNFFQWYSLLKKNGVNAFRGDRFLSSATVTTAGDAGSAASAILEMNGSTDYVSVYGFVDLTTGGSGPGFFHNSNGTGSYFQAHLIRKL